MAQHNHANAKTQTVENEGKTRQRFFFKVIQLFVGKTQSGSCGFCCCIVCENMSGGFSRALFFPFRSFVFFFFPRCVWTFEFGGKKLELRTPKRFIYI